MATAASLGFAAMDRLMPMHAIISTTGHITHAGPTLQKLRPGKGLVGERFLEAFELLRPRNANLSADLVSQSGTRLTLRIRENDGLRLKGLALPLPGGEGLLINLSFGISVADAITAFRLSAADFAPTDLAIEMLYLVEAKEAVTAESRQLNMRLLSAKSSAEAQAFSDMLTGLQNRRAMDVILARYESTGDPFSLLLLDLDKFKEVNDTHGHAAGDFVLEQTARVLTEETRETDSVIRLGGDEFALVLHDQYDPTILSRIADRVIARLEGPMMFQGKALHISCSIGITISEDYKTVSAKQMLIDADVALYQAKRQGRARHCFVRNAGGVGQVKLTA